MKNIFFLLLFSFIFSSAFSQHISNDLLHSTIAKASKGTSVAASNNIPALITSLQKKMPVSKKVDILYDVASGYLRSLKIDSALFYAQEIKTIADSAAYEAGLAKYYLARGSALFYRNKGAEVIQSLQQAISLFTKYNNNLFLGLSYHQLARQLANTNDYAGAQKFYRLAIPLIAASDDVNKLQWVVHNCGRNFYFTLELDSAVFYLASAIKLAEKLRSDAKIFNSASMLGTVYMMADNANEAEQTLKYALAVQPASADKIQLRGVWANYAEVLIMNGKYDAAAKAIKEYEKINALFGDVSGNMTEKKLKGSLLYRQGNYTSAYNNLQDAYQLKNENDLFSYDLMGIAFSLGKTELKTGEADSAIVHFKLADRLALKANYIAGVLEANMLLAEAFQQNKQLDSAYRYFRYYAHLRDSLLTFKKEKTVMELSARYNAEKREQQIKNLKAEQEILAYQIALKNKTIYQQQLLDIKKSQQLTLVTQQSEIHRLQASEKNLALENRGKEFIKKQSELELLQKEKQLQSALAAKQAQQKNLLFVISAAILLLGGYGWFRSRQNKKLSNQLSQSLKDLKEAQHQIIKAEKEKEAENIRLRISRDIHDEVGATLSGVALFSEIAKQKMEDHQEKDAGEYLQHISDSSKEMVEKMSDIVWTINPKNDSFDHIITKLKAYAVNLCASKGIKLHLNIDETVKEYHPEMQVRKHIYLLIKEAINNAVKYSGGKNIFFYIQKNNGCILVTIKDDGKGFDKSLIVAGNGLSNMQSRAMELDARLTIDSANEAGTTITLLLNIHPIGVHRHVE